MKIVYISIFLLFLIALFFFVKYGNILSAVSTDFSFLVTLTNTGDETLENFQFKGTPIEFNTALVNCNLNELQPQKTYTCLTNQMNINDFPVGDNQFDLEITAYYNGNPITEISSEIITVSGDNLVTNPSFSEGKTGWDLRPGAGPDGISELGIIDTEIYRTAPASLKIPPSEYTGTDVEQHDRTIWQNYRIPVSQYRGQTIKLTAWVRHSDCSSAPYSPCWVNSNHKGDTELTNWDCCNIYNICENPSHFQGPWCSITDRGGARLGMDFRDANNQMFKEHMVIADWTTADNEWHKLEIITDVPENYVPPGRTESYDADNVIVWIQGFEYDAPATVWMDDVSVTIMPDNVKYLIVTTSSVEPYLSDLKAHRQQDYNVKTILVDGMSRTEIKDEIKKELLNLGYILVVGTESTVPSSTDDNYFADRDDDGNPDYAIGRIPTESQSKIQNVIDKTIKFENEKMYNKKKILFSGGSENPDPTASGFQTCNYWRGKEPDYVGWDINYVCCNCNNTYTECAGNDQLIIDYINEGQTIVTFKGHGNRNTLNTGCSYADNMNLEDNDVDRMNNYYPFIFITFSCEVMSFIEHNSYLTTRMLTDDEGAVAFIGTTGTSLFPDSLLNEILKQQTLGDAFKNSRANTPVQLLGDPALKIK